MSKKNQDKVIAERVMNPLDTTREIADRIGVDHSTVARIDKKMPQNATKDSRIISLTDTDLDIVTRSQEIIKMKLNDEELVKDMNIRDISTVAKDSAARYSLFRWDATDREWGAKSISELDLLD